MRCFAIAHSRWKKQSLLVFLLAGWVTACSPDRYKTYYIPSESMLPTLQVNDRIVVDRSYYRSHPPQRGDLVIFQPPIQLSQMLQGIMPIDQKTVFVKRVIGLPGDWVEVKQGRVYVNQQPLIEAYLTEAPTYIWGPIAVPSDSLVVLGDNRNNALDSHYWGLLPQRNLLGKVIWRYWPPDRFGALPEAGLNQDNFDSNDLLFHGIFLLRLAGILSQFR